MSELKEEHKPKGTVVLVYFFLAVMIVYYWLSWKWLSELWLFG